MFLSIRTLIIFYVESVNKDHRELWSAPEVVSTLKKLRSSLDILEIRIAKFEPVGTKLYSVVFLI